MTDVSVIVAVYNTMPYLTACLNSLVTQSIGLHRMEVIAVDDGSTDGSGAELERFAALYPGFVTVLHQENSGGPAAPANRALDLAVGRYVYFVGADDHLGPEALERLVANADRYRSDVLLGKVVGVNGRTVHQEIYRSDQAKVEFFGSPLRWSLSDTKLFRRAFVEEHGLRFPEDMPISCDQPFTIAALLHARTISVLSSYTCYYAVRRADSSNITFNTAPLVEIANTAKLMNFVADRIEPGPDRDWLLRRHFEWEVAVLLLQGFRELPAETKEQLCARIAELADLYLTDRVRDELGLTSRVLICLAWTGAIPDLEEFLRLQAEGRTPPIHLTGDDALSRYDFLARLPEAWFRLTGRVADRIASGTVTVSAGFEHGLDGQELTITTNTPLVGPAALRPAQVRLGLVPRKPRRKIPGPRRVAGDRAVPTGLDRITLEQTDWGTEFQSRIPVDALIAAHRAGAARKHTVHLFVDVGGTTYEIPMRGAPEPAQVRRWQSARIFRVSALVEEEHLVIAIARIKPLRVVRRRLGKLVGSGPR
ncbi:MAG: glycosyltransferase [Streptosporangiaceae bacterium]